MRRVVPEVKMVMSIPLSQWHFGLVYRAVPAMHSQCRTTPGRVCPAISLATEENPIPQTEDNQPPHAHTRPPWR
ncbi:hypothetical protein JCM12141A_52400 [Mycolicibacterium hodleri]